MSRNQEAEGKRKTGTSGLGGVEFGNQETRNEIQTERVRQLGLECRFLDSWLLNFWNIEIRNRRETERRMLGADGMKEEATRAAILRLVAESARSQLRARARNFAAGCKIGAGINSAQLRRIQPRRQWSRDNSLRSFFRASCCDLHRPGDARWGATLFARTRFVSNAKHTPSASAGAKA